MYKFNHFDHFDLPDLESAKQLLQAHNCNIALIKALPKNANDKNQVYIHSDASLLNSIFALEFSDREASTSQTKKLSKPGKKIPEAVFESFSWLGLDGQLAKTRACKAIVYAQYPEARLSGFLTTDGEIPRSISIDYTKSKELLPRYLLIGATKTGEAIAMIAVAPGPTFVKEFKELENYFGSSVCKALIIEQENGTKKLEAILRTHVAEKTLIGCRFDREGNTIPFTGTQVHGYTLEHACGIKPNADKNGDIFGIELKCFTRKKLTLFTPEPDGGLYKDNFNLFMTTHGYKKDGVYRLTGLHRAYKENPRTELTLKIVCQHAIKKKDETGKKHLQYEAGYYNPEIPITKQMTDMKVVLEDRVGNIAASWSLERLLNCWGAKHNEVVYVPAEKIPNEDEDTLKEGYKWKIKFSNKVLWCNKTSVEKLFQAIHNGTVYLDPAPKYNPNNAKDNKRRSQWRINDIYKAAESLYVDVNTLTLI
ncbi:MvaI/BcnI family restriction endonuclease [Vibrio sp. Of7-15]|uniref:MvaI/BcnI family restriction endonuclease n=1 Tax=Vibrio sp. Of7-15 TaxID=2724879 RepID=UPI001EF374A8|nr:MvaI/BcnI family restriction endonuclease [Vibrio sp. Of7-15]MCG7500021.1 MvaI/BcnI family restriction endonuclease [Vibrio sp. Of7-15]